MFLAGFYGDDIAWNRVAEHWRKAINPRKTLHVTKLRFKLDRDKRLLQRAGVVPAQCGLVPIVGGVKQGDFKDLIFGSKEERVLSGYIICLWAMLHDTLRSLPTGEQLKLVFEEQTVYQPFAEVAIRVCIDNPSPSDLLPDGRHKLASWSWVPKEDTILTQPADYFAFALSKAWKEPGSVKDQWCRPILGTKGGNGFGAILSREQVRQAISDGMVNRILDEAKRRFKEGVL